MPELVRTAALKALTQEQAEALRFDWEFWARDKQLPPPGNWGVWLYMAGRGAGKTRTAAEWIKRREAEGYRRFAFVGQTPADVRDVMIEGESGILNVYPEGRKPSYEPTKRRVTWASGAMAITYSGANPEQLRGPQHDCLIAGTAVLTPSGYHAIESLLPGDTVVTSDGIRRVQAVGCKLDRVGEVRFSNRSVLIGTANHRVLTSHGWTILRDLVWGDSAWSVKPTGSSRSGCLLQKTSSGRRHPMATCKDGTGRGQPGGGVSCGNKLMGRSLLGMSSTILMPPGAMMTYPTYDLSPRQIITDSIISLTLPNALIVESWLPERSARLWRSFAGNVRAEEQSASERLSRYASNAVKCSSPALELTAVNVVSTWEAAGLDLVYDITVEGRHEYFANGILVHNSVWVDELAAFKYPRETWDNLSLGLRLSADPRAVITTTPKPLSILREIRDDPHTVTITEATYANRLNVSEMFFRTVVARYEGTRTGRQEIYAELLDEAEGALWKRSYFEPLRVKTAPEARRIVIGVDPAASHTQDSSETGIIVAMLGVDGHGYVLADGSGRYSPDAWATRVIHLLDTHRADRIIAEVNQGGEMVSFTLRTIRPSAPVKSIHASRSKQARAEPVAALYEQGRVHHLGQFPELEDQLVSWEPLSGEPSPDRLDALVWALTELMVGNVPTIVRGATKESRWRER